MINMHVGSLFKQRGPKRFHSFRIDLCPKATQMVGFAQVDSRQQCQKPSSAGGPPCLALG